MSKLIEHINSGDWIKYFKSEDIGHLISFTYNLIKWIDRDDANTLECQSKEFKWSKNNQVVGVFPITVPEPTPTFISMLLYVIERDKVIQKSFDITYDGDRIFRFARK